MNNILNKINAIDLKQNWPMIAVSLLGVYLITAGASLAAFSLLGNSKGVSPAEVSQVRSRIDTNQPKTQECPMNGQMYTKDEENIWKGRRPITAIIENHVDARPQSGLSKSDIVYEAVAEGGITRFLAVFYCGASAADVRIGPLRSARIYFINWAAEYADKPLFVHVGGANNICSNCPGGVKPPGQVAKNVQALEELTRLGWRYEGGNDLDGGTTVNFPDVWRDYERIPGVASEHTYMGSTDKLFAQGVKRGFGFNDASGTPWNKNFRQWKFADGKPTSSPSYSQISFQFWKNQPDYDVSWKYDAANNQYLRVNGGKAFIDLDSKEQLSAKNVIVQFVQEQDSVDQEKHTFVQDIGSGNILLFQNGTVQQGTWEKTLQSGRTVYKVNGHEVSFVRGRIWIEALPIGNQVSY